MERLARLKEEENILNKEKMEFKVMQFIVSYTSRVNDNCNDIFMRIHKKRWDHITHKGRRDQITHKGDNIAHDTPHSPKIGKSGKRMQNTSQDNNSHLPKK